MKAFLLVCAGLLVGWAIGVNGRITVNVNAVEKTGTYNPPISATPFSLEDLFRDYTGWDEGESEDEADD